jgi:hypothetical protein
MTPPFERTACACHECRACCKSPAHLVAGDAERIAAYLGTDLAGLLPLLRVGRGAVVGNSRTGRVWRVPTVVPATTAGRCVFQLADGACLIHEVAPFGCAYFDIHMSAETAAPRSAWGLRTIIGNADYDALLAAVAAAKET